MGPQVGGWKKERGGRDLDAGDKGLVGWFLRKKNKTAGVLLFTLVLKTAANPILLSCDRRCPLMLHYLRPTSHGYHVAQLMEHTLELHGAGRLFFM